MDKSELSRRAVLIFRAALDLPEAKRTGYLEREIGSDRELAREVQALLGADSSQTRSTKVAGNLVSVADELMQRQLLCAGARFGAFKLMRELGRGGMGVVWLAERSDGQFAQRVAIKFVRQSTLDSELKQRFAQERQILAQLNHPHIARLIDGGIDDGGEPWFAMEYVEGVPLLEYCDRKQLTIDQRIVLFQQVCAAVGFAHRNLIVHRDLKPANVLVDHLGDIKLLDFGVAKFLQVGERSPTQTTGTQIFTPAYAAPEQILGRTISTATDVHALGLLLFELLCGGHPYRKETAFELQRSIIEDTPRSLLKALNDAAGDGSDLPLVASRSTDLKQIKKLLSGDLSAVVMHCLEKDPAARYGSAEMLHADLARYRAGHAVSAARVTRLGQARRWLRRNPALTAALSLTLLSLLSGLGVSLYQADRAKQAQFAAESALLASNASLRFLERTLGLSDARLLGRPNVKVREVLEVARSQIEELPRDAQAVTLMALANAYGGLGDHRAAIDLAKRALERAQTPTNMQEAKMLWAEAALELGDLRQTLAITKELLADQSTPTLLRIKAQRLELEVASELGTLAPGPEGVKRVERLIQDAAVITTDLQWSGRAPLALRMQQLRMWMLSNDASERQPELEQLYQRALSKMGPAHPDVLALKGEMIFNKAQRDKHEQLARIEQLQAWRQESASILGESHPGALGARIMHADALRELDPDAAVAELGEVIKLGSSLGEPVHPVILRSWIQWSDIEAYRGGFNESNYLAFKAVVESGCDGQYTAVCRLGLRRLANDARNLERWEECEAINRELIALNEKSFGADDPRTLTEVLQYGRALVRQARYLEANKQFTRAFDGFLLQKEPLEAWPTLMRFVIRDLRNSRQHQLALHYAERMAADSQKFDYEESQGLEVEQSAGRERAFVLATMGDLDAAGAQIDAIYGYRKPKPSEVRNASAAESYMRIHYYAEQSAPLRQWYEAYRRLKPNDQSVVYADLELNEILRMAKEPRTK